MSERVWKILDRKLEGFAIWILARLDERALSRVTKRAR